MKKLLAIAVATAFAAPAISMADTTLYGHLKAGLWSLDTGAGNETDLRDDGTRIGVKGSTPLNNGLTATYVMEFGADLTDNNQNGGTLSGRQTYVGVKGGFGEVRAGKMWGPTKLSSGKVEMFGDVIGDYNGGKLSGAGLQSGTVEPSVKDAIAYVNKFGNVGVAVAATEDAASFGAGNVVGAGDVSAVDAMINYSNNGLYLAAGHQNVHKLPDTTRLTAAYQFPAGHQVGAAIEQIDMGTLGADVDSYVISGKYKMGNTALKAQYADSDNGTIDANQITVGVDYSLGKKTTVYAVASDGENAANVDVDGYGVGIIHKF